MKILIQKISMLVIGVIASLCVQAQVIKITATVNSPIGALTEVIDNGEIYNATAISNLNAYLPVSVKIENTGTSNLVLELTGGKYIILSNTGASDFSVNESSLTGTILPGGSQTFSIGISSSPTNGSKSLSVSIKSNSISNSTGILYTGTINYSFSGITTALTKASDIGLSLYPNPSNDGALHVIVNNVKVERIVVSNAAGQTEEFSATEFKTSLKGLVLVRLYTDKGVVSEKIIIQE